MDPHCKLLKAQSNIIQLIASGEQLEHILLAIVANIESMHEQLYGSILLYDPALDRLGNLISRSLPKQFKKNINYIDIGPYEGSCGAAAFLKQSVYVDDIQSDPLLKNYRNELHPFGIDACWSTPLLSTKGDLLGTFCLWFKEQCKLNLVKFAFELYNKLAAIAIQISATTKEIEMYHHKVSQPTTEFIDDVDDESLLKQLQIGIERDEFAVYYQPYFTLSTGQLGIEALLRWNHPYAGLLAPHAFLSIAEKTGFIVELEEWVLERSIKDAVKLLRSGVNLHSLSVNISAKQLENKSFPDFVHKLLQRYDFKPEYLTLEITERFLIQRENIDVLHTLKQIGIQISIDDFGTSYSSLNYLKDLPVDELKIDRSFISNMDQDMNKQKIVEMIILLGKQLDLTIVAEGVETEKELTLLKGMNCHAVQGYYFSKPIPFSTFKEKYT